MIIVKLESEKNRRKIVEDERKLKGEKKYG